jgi:hypothetical protein
MGVISSIYQFAGSSTKVVEVGARGFGSGFIQVEAERWGEKSMGVMVGVLGRKYGFESWWVRDVSICCQYAMLMIAMQIWRMKLTYRTESNVLPRP